MKFFIDTADIDEIRELAETGLVDGVTTNPSLVAKTGRRFVDIVKEICSVIDGPVSAEVTAVDHRGMLAEGRHLALLVDQKMNDGIAVPFFGRDAMTAPAAAQLALRFGCAIMPARVERLHGARFRITMSPPIAAPRTGDRHADMRAIMGEINRVIEGWVRERPEMWLWLHRRWPD